MTDVITPAQLIDQYISMRREKKKYEDEFAAAIKVKYEVPMAEIETKVLVLLNEMGLDSIKGDTGTAYKKVNTSVTIADGPTFRRHVIGLEAWDMINWVANKTAVNDLIEAGEPLPPGLNRSTFVNVGFRMK